jgi:hypothetical protein
MFCQSQSNRGVMTTHSCMQQQQLANALCATPSRSSVVRCEHEGCRA